jgi:hypothetical protein
MDDVDFISQDAIRLQWRSSGPDGEDPLLHLGVALEGCDKLVQKANRRLSALVDILFVM